MQKARRSQGVTSPGDVQWMTAGSGIIHQEKPKGKDDGLVRGFHREELRIAFDEYDKGTFIKRLKALIEYLKI